MAPISPAPRRLLLLTSTFRMHPRTISSSARANCLKYKSFVVDRFPVTRFHKEGADSVVEILELRFPQVRPDRPAAFTYRVRFDASGT